MRPGRRVVVPAIVALAGVVLAIAIFVLLPPVVALDPSLVVPSERQKAVADTRTSLVALLAVLGGLGGLYYTDRTFHQSRVVHADAARTAAQTLKLGEKGQLTDRYAKGVEMLGSGSPDVCIGGIHALGQIMTDVPDYREQIVAVLSAFVRRTAKRRSDGAPPWPVDEAERDEDKPSFPVQAAMTVLARAPRPGIGSTLAADLRDSDLRGARLRGAHLEEVNLRRVFLRKGKLSHANLRGTVLERAVLIDADLSGADLTGARLAGAEISGANLLGATIIRDAISPKQLRSARNGHTVHWVDGG